ncbi:MAG: hypothetical protein DWQ07_14030 [Chloroflexi bacterium]|nr:MAG: hypothetical protein DWQ07_14030 [Chloroflexota bacterium]
MFRFREWSIGLRIFFEKADFWVGIYFSNVQSDEFDIYVCLIPFLPINVWGNRSVNDPYWLCVCGHYEESDFHCSRCGAEPPWGCDCSYCDERYRYPEDFIEEYPEVDPYEGPYEDGQ